jgi:hypothetical protein
MDAEVRQHERQEVMRRIAAHDQEVRAGIRQAIRRLHELRQRALTLAEDGRCAVGDVRVVVDEDGDVVLILARIRRKDDLLHEIHRCHRAHAANNTDRLHLAHRDHSSMLQRLSARFLNS